MPYTEGIIMMAQNLLRETANNPNMDANRFYMLWNAILSYHFPPTAGYGVGLEHSGNLQHLVVKFIGASESIVLVVNLKKPLEDTEEGREDAQKELVEFVEDDVDIGEEFGTIYAIAGIGLSWASFTMQMTDPQDIELVHGWTSNITAAASFDRMRKLARIIDHLTGAKRE